MREKKLPELDDDFAVRGVGVRDARRAARRDPPRGSPRASSSRAEAEFREAAVDAVAANAKLEIPHDLVHARAHEMWERIERQLASRGIDPQAYAQMQGKDRHDLIDDAEEDAERALRREAVLAAVADAEGIEPTDEELIEALGPGEGKNDPAKLLARLRETGRDQPAARRGPDAQGGRRWSPTSAKPIAMERAAAREQIWTPEKERGRGRRRAAVRARRGEVRRARGRRLRSNRRGRRRYDL